jgi:hypothetical protein
MTTAQKQNVTKGPGALPWLPDYGQLGNSGNAGAERRTLVAESSARVAQWWLQAGAFEASWRAGHAGRARNCAIFEIPEILEALLGESHESPLLDEEFIRTLKGD